MAITYIDWRNDKDFKHKNDIQCVWEGCEFYEEGDDFLVYHNEDNGKYAVYYKLHGDGVLVSLVEDFSNLMSMSWDSTDNFMDRVESLFRQHALEHGFPGKHPELPKHYMTWRDLLNRLCDLDKEVLDMPAWVWVHDDAAMSEGDVPIIGLSTYNADLPISADNHLSISIDD